MSAQPVMSLSPEEYLAIERQSDHKSEYIEGQIYALAGASQRHNIIVANVVASLHQQLRRRPCTVYPSDMRVQAPDMKFYAYPDISVACAPIQLADSQQDTLLNPVVIIEVLSKSTENFDRGRKFKLYRAIESLQEYILIAQDSLYIEQFIRQPDHQWLFTAADTINDNLHLSSIACDLALADVYEKVEDDLDE